jgi:hypothetical protein
MLYRQIGSELAQSKCIFRFAVAHYPCRQGTFPVAAVVVAWLHDSSQESSQKYTSANKH